MSFLSKRCLVWGGAADRYSDEFSRAPHAELGRLAAAEIAARGGAIVDATVRRRRDREAFAQAFAAAARVIFIESGASAHVVVARLGLAVSA